ncbi:hypothetical protein GW17_00050504 [Ensete ventricosum]|nr:hypothetical protein GW17_00050504 [Ensete ventricosum]
MRVVVCLSIDQGKLLREHRGVEADYGEDGIIPKWASLTPGNNANKTIAKLEKVQCGEAEALEKVGALKKSSNG